MPPALKLLRYFFSGKAQRVFCLQALIALAFCAGGRALWSAFEKDISAQESYRVELKNIRVFNPPKWVSNDLIQEALAYRPPDVRDAELNSLDVNLPKILLTAFSQHPWVSGVEKIVVKYPGKVDVWLRFKTPIAVVDPTQAVAGDFENAAGTAGTAQNGEQTKNDENAKNQENDDDFSDFSGDETSSNAEKYVVDAEGYRLPDEYFRQNPNEYYEFLWILGIYSTPTTDHGRCADPLVADAAQFADFLVQNDVPKKLGINRIVVLRTRGATRETYRLKTNNETVVEWGRFAASATSLQQEAPKSDEIEQEIRPEKIKELKFRYQKEKLTRLLNVAQTYGSLDAVPDAKKAELDLSNYLTDEDGARANR